MNYARGPTNKRKHSDLENEDSDTINDCVVRDSSTFGYEIFEGRCTCYYEIIEIDPISLPLDSGLPIKVRNRIEKYTSQIEDRIDKCNNRTLRGQAIDLVEEIKTVLGFPAEIYYRISQKWKPHNCDAFLERAHDTLGRLGLAKKANIIGNMRGRRERLPNKKYEDYILSPSVSNKTVKASKQADKQKEDANDPNKIQQTIAQKQPTSNPDPSMIINTEQAPDNNENVNMLQSQQSASTKSPTRQQRRKSNSQQTVSNNKGQDHHGTRSSGSQPNDVHATNRSQTDIQQQLLGSDKASMERQATSLQQDDNNPISGLSQPNNKSVMSSHQPDSTSAAGQHQPTSKPVSSRSQPDNTPISGQYQPDIRPVTELQQPANKQISGKQSLVGKTSAENQKQVRQTKQRVRASTTPIPNSMKSSVTKPTTTIVDKTKDTSQKRKPTNQPKKAASTTTPKETTNATEKVMNKSITKTSNIENDKKAETTTVTTAPKEVFYIPSESDTPLSTPENSDVERAKKEVQLRRQLRRQNSNNSTSSSSTYNDEDDDDSSSTSETSSIRSIKQHKDSSDDTSQSSTDTSIVSINSSSKSKARMQSTPLTNKQVGISNTELGEGTSKQTETRGKTHATNDERNTQQQLKLELQKLSRQVEILGNSIIKGTFDLDVAANRKIWDDIQRQVSELQSKVNTGKRDSEGGGSQTVSGNNTKRNVKRSASASPKDKPQSKKAKEIATIKTSKQLKAEDPKKEYTIIKHSKVHQRELLTLEYKPDEGSNKTKEVKVTPTDALELMKFTKIKKYLDALGQKSVNNIRQWYPILTLFLDTESREKLNKDKLSKLEQNMMDAHNIWRDKHYKIVAESRLKQRKIKEEKKEQQTDE